MEDPAGYDRGGHGHLGGCLEQRTPRCLTSISGHLVRRTRRSSCPIKVTGRRNRCGSEAPAGSRLPPSGGIGRRILSSMNRRGPMVVVAALAVLALVFAILSLHRASTLTTVAATLPRFPPAVSATSVPVVVSASASARASSSASGLPVAAFLGDDYIGGVGASSHGLRWSSLVATHFAWTEKNFGFGGTGYSTGGKLAGGTPYSERIAAVAAASPSIVIVAGGRDDVVLGSSPTQIQAAVTATFTGLRTALPNAAIVAESPLWPVSKPPATLVQLAADVKAAVTAVGGRYLDVGQPLVGVPADIAPNPALPSDAGYAALAKAFETAYDS